MLNYIDACFYILKSGLSVSHQLHGSKTLYKYFLAKHFKVLLIFLKHIILTLKHPTIVFSQSILQGTFNFFQCSTTTDHENFEGNSIFSVIKVFGKAKKL